MTETRTAIVNWKRPIICHAYQESPGYPLVRRSRPRASTCGAASSFRRRAPAVGGAGGVLAIAARAQARPRARRSCPTSRRVRFSTDREGQPYEDVTTYNNFYEFGTDKDDPGATRRRSRRGPGRSRSKGSASSRAPTTSKTSSSRTRSRSASTACAASRRGRWSFRGSASRWAT